MRREFYAYRAHGDEVGTSERTMATDPGTGEYPYLHAAGDVISFDSEEERDAYVARQVVTTTLEGGCHRRFHWVSSITPEEAAQFLEACATGRGCIHKSLIHLGRIRIPE